MSSSLYLFDKKGLGGLNLWLRPGGFNPASLFGTTDTGWFYDLSDMSTLYQDAAGTTPVTAVGQPVGLQLDKSKGLVLGPELVVNGGFDTDLSGWANNGSAVWVGGAAEISQAGSATILSQGVAIVPGKTYEFTCDCTAFTSGALAFRTTTGATVGAFVISAVGSFRAVVTAGAANNGIRFTSQSAGFVGSIDNISVRELTGNHRSQSVSLNRPTLRQDTNGLYYLEYDGLNDSLSTSAFAWGTDKATVVAGVMAASPRSNNSPVWQIGDTTTSATDALIKLATGDGSLDSYRLNLVGTGNNLTTRVAKYVPYTAVFSSIIDASQAGSGELSLRENGAVTSVGSPVDSGVTSIGTQAAFFGVQASGIGFFNGREYSQFAINRLLTENELSQIERYTAQRTGVTI